MSSTILNRIETFRKKNFDRLRDHYLSLKNGQKPHALFITCSDSRLCPHEFTQSKAGELFVIRNAGNMLPAYNPDCPSNEGLTLEYGVISLKVKEVIVCGHSYCGAMEGLQNIRKVSSMPLVHRGLGLYRERHKSEISKCKDLNQLITWNVNNQLSNILTYPLIINKVSNGELSIHGIVYDFTQAKIIFHSYVNTQLEIVNEI